MPTDRPTQFGDDGIAKPLTREMLKATFNQIANMPDPCAKGHVVSPRAYRQGGWTNCGNCGKAVFCGGD